MATAPHPQAAPLHPHHWTDTLEGSCTLRPVSSPGGSKIHQEKLGATRHSRTPTRRSSVFGKPLRRNLEITNKKLPPELLFIMYRQRKTKVFEESLRKSLQQCMSATERAQSLGGEPGPWAAAAGGPARGGWASLWLGVFSSFYFVTNFRSNFIITMHFIYKALIKFYKVWNIN